MIGIKYNYKKKIKQIVPVISFVSNLRVCPQRLRLRSPGYTFLAAWNGLPFGEKTGRLEWEEEENLLFLTFYSILLIYFSFLNYILWVTLLQLSWFSPFATLHPAPPLPQAIPTPLFMSVGRGSLVQVVWQLLLLGTTTTVADNKRQLDVDVGPWCGPEWPGLTQSKLRLLSSVQRPPVSPKARDCGAPAGSSSRLAEYPGFCPRAVADSQSAGDWFLLLCCTLVPPLFLLTP